MSAILVPGDLLCYSGTGFFSTLIKVKTWSSISHVEVVCDVNGTIRTAASRDGIGVGTYGLRTDGLRLILRPTEPVDLVAALRWHETTIGQSYDWLGLLRFFTLGKQSKFKQFCSEYATRFYRAGGFDPFATSLDADLVAPGTFLMSPKFTVVWKADA